MIIYGGGNFKIFVRLHSAEGSEKFNYSKIHIAFLEYVTWSVHFVKCNVLRSGCCQLVFAEDMSVVLLTPSEEKKKKDGGTWPHFSLLTSISLQKLYIRLFYY